MRLSRRGAVWYERQPAHRTIGYNEKTANIEQLTERFDCFWDYKGMPRRMHVCDEYIWDGASVPRVAWSLIGLTPWGLTDAPSLIHDELYRSQGGRKTTPGCLLQDSYGKKIVLEREEADWLFYALLVFAGVAEARAAAAYAAVRIGGAKHWGGPCPTPFKKQLEGQPGK